jgi:probable rRNA maturation factor
MLEVAVLPESPWPSIDWETLAAAAVRAAFAESPYGEWIDHYSTFEISVRLTDDEAVRQLNAQYRGKDKPTNVLSFPMVQPDLLDTVSMNSDDGEVLLGDIVLAHGVCAAEATERAIPVEAHAQHLIVHGTLHLLGFDHERDPEAEVMEEMERAALTSLGLHDPYPVRED